MKSNTPLILRDLWRSYGKNTEKRAVVRGVSLEVGPGEIVALLGPNGAGKTTTVKMASTLLLPDSGEIRVCGVDAVRHPREACARTSLLLGGERGFYLRMSARDNLGFFATLAGVPLGAVRERVDRSLAAVSLAERADDRVETYSRGMRQRLHVARALLGEPGLILLDEPTTGLDPESAASVRELVGTLRSRGVGILLTTHSMAEAEQLSDRVAIIEGGRIVAEGTVPELAGQVQVGLVSSFSAASLDADAVAQVEALQNVMMVNVTEKVGSWDIDVGRQGVPETGLPAAAAAWTHVGDRPATLEELYLAILREARARTAAAAADHAASQGGEDRG